MIASVEIVICVATVLGMGKLTTAEYARLRKSRQLGRALRRSLSC